jgi:hypothetical protein
MNVVSAHFFAYPLYMETFSHATHTTVPCRLLRVLGVGKAKNVVGEKAPSIDGLTYIQVLHLAETGSKSHGIG